MRKRESMSSFGEQPEEQSKSLFERLNLDQAKKIATGVGVAAVAGALIGGGITVSSNAEKAPVVATSTSEQEASLLALQKILVGGNTDPTGFGVEGILNGLGMLRPGDQIHRVEYSANVAEQERSSSEGAQRAVAEAEALRGRGETVMLIGFSLGGDVVARAGQQIAEANGGVLPHDVQVVSYGGPASSTGFWAALPGKVGEPWAAMFGVNMDARLPAGSHEHSDQNDIWGNSANQYLTGNMLQAFAAGTGSHRVPHENEPRIEWVDEYGVRHFRYNVGLNPMVAMAKSQNLYMAPGSEGYWNAAANAAVPMNNGRDGLANPDGQAVIDNLARAFDIQAGTGNLFFIMSRFLPAPFVQFGLDIANKVPNALAEGWLQAQNGVINAPQNIQNGLEQAAQVPASVTSPDSVPAVTLNVAPAPASVETPAPAVVTPEVPVLPAAVVPEVVAPVVEVVEAVNDVVEVVVPAAPEVPVVPEVVQEVVEVVEAVVEPVVEAIQEIVPPAPVEVPPAPAVYEAPAPAPEPVYVAPPAPVYEAPIPVVEVPAPVMEVVAPIVDLLPLPEAAPAV